MSSEPESSAAREQRLDLERSASLAAAYFGVADHLIPDLALLAGRSSRLSTTILAAYVIECLLRSFILFHTRTDAEWAGCAGLGSDAWLKLTALWARAAQLGLKTSPPDWIGLWTDLEERPDHVGHGGIDGPVLPVAKRVLRCVVQLADEIRAATQ